MTENNKPEWFEITDADEKPAVAAVVAGTVAANKLANPAISKLPTGGDDDDDDDDDDHGRGRGHDDDHEDDEDDDEGDDD